MITLCLSVLTLISVAHCYSNDTELVKVSSFYGCNRKKTADNIRVLPDKETYDINDQITFQCQNDMTLVGERIQHCTGFDVWNTDDPICTIINCPPDYLSDAFTTFEYEQIAGEQVVVAYYTCHDPTFEPVPHKRTCGHHDQWDAELPSCKPRCDLPMPPANGTVVSLCHYEFCEAHYKCDHGFVMMGDETGECQHHKWQFFNEPPECHPVSCGLAPNVNRGQAYYMYHKIKGAYSVSARVEYKCEYGYSPVNGSQALICDANGKWTGTPPECVSNAVLCPSESIEDGQTETRDWVVTYKCDFGFRLVGEDERNCLGEQGWSGQRPRCEYSPPCVEPNSVQFADKTLNPTQVNKVKRYAFGSQVTYECLQNKSQVVTQTCNASGLWGGEDVPKCLNPKFLNATNFQHAWRTVFAEHKHWVGGFTHGYKMSTFDLFVTENQNWTGLYLTLAMQEKTGGQMLLRVEYHNHRYIVSQRKLVEAGDFFSEDFEFSFDGFLLKEDDKLWHFYSLDVKPEQFNEVHMIARDDGATYHPQTHMLLHKSTQTAALSILAVVSALSLLLLAALGYKRRYHKQKAQHRARAFSSFENPIYNSDGSTKPLKDVAPIPN